MPNSLTVSSLVQFQFEAESANPLNLSLAPRPKKKSARCKMTTADGGNFETALNDFWVWGRMG
jgi:hypothetical protein